MNLSFARVHQMENGRDVVSEAYIVKFLNAIGLEKDEWFESINDETSKASIRDECYALIGKINDDKIEILIGILKSFITK